MNNPNATVSQSIDFDKSYQDDRGQTLRIRLGEQLRHNKLAILVSTLLALLVGGIGLIAPVLNVAGIPLSLLVIWGLSRLKQTGWSELGFKRPASWGKTIALGAGVALFMQASAGLVIVPLLARLGAQTPDVSAYAEIEASLSMLLVYLVVSWTTAGFGEEIIWRGFVMPRIAYLFGDRKIGWVIGLIVSSILFGLIHYPQGITGMVMTGFIGFVFGVLFLSTGRNLWFSIIAHGLTDTIAFVLLFYAEPFRQMLGV